MQKNKGPYNKSKFYLELESNFPCPCLSGQLYGECHKKSKNLNYNSNINFELFKQKMPKRNNNKTYKCMFNNCNNIPINSHTIQKNKYVNFVCDEFHAVSESKTNSKIIQNEMGFLSTVKVEGKNKLSTFWGFCKEHDNNLFVDIEKEDISASERQNILLCYRSICRAVYEMHDIVMGLKEVFLLRPNLAKFRWFISEWTEMYSEYIQKVEIKSYIENQVIKNKNNLIYKTFILESQRNLTCSCMLWVMKDTKNKRICSQYAYFHSKGEGAVFISILPDESKTKVIFSCLDYAPKTMEFLEQLEQLSINELKSLINHLIFGFSDVGVVMNPKWYYKNKDNFYSQVFGTIATNIQIQIKDAKEKNKLTQRDLIWD